MPMNCMRSIMVERPDNRWRPTRLLKPGQPGMDKLAAAGSIIRAVTGLPCEIGIASYRAANGREVSETSVLLRTPDKSWIEALTPEARRDILNISCAPGKLYSRIEKAVHADLMYRVLADRNDPVAKAYMAPPKRKRG